MTRLCNKFHIFPHGNAVYAPEAAERPTRQWLARIPFSLTIMKKPAGSHFFAKSLNHSQATGPLVVAEGIDIPLSAFWFINADVGRLAAHGQADIVRLKVLIHAVCDLSYTEPLLFGIAPRLRSRIAQASEGQFVAEVGAWPLGGSRDWGSLGST